MPGVCSKISAKKYKIILLFSQVAKKAYVSY